ncbi:type IV secretion system protein [Arcobacter lanthieri]|uniref:type IV secretion system protein n=1 Tax=Aliarcobacter lanthieri TaxID=1355374 RepID=UPI00192165EA|nr:type IV secretion system protein [Aliarcobacter lanthieri]MBL3519512.1 type IV secretion system protein [Aliarcobacter lanthieri]
MGIFQYIGNWISELFDFLKSSSNTEVVQALSTLVGLTIILQIMIKAYQVMAGKSQSPTQELIWDIAVKMLIISIALNLSGFLDAIKSSMEELHNLMSGDNNLYAVLDEKLTATMKLADIVYDEGNAFSGPFYAIIIFLSFLLGIVPSFLIVVTTDITLRLLLLIAPIVIFFRAYSWGKQMFDQWLSTFFTNLLTVFMVGIMLSLFVDKYGNFINHQSAEVGQNVNLLMITGQTIIMSLLLFFLMKLVVTMAEKIGSVSIESAPKSASSLNDSRKSAQESLKNLSNDTGMTKAGSKAASAARTGYQATVNQLSGGGAMKNPFLK